ncbi:MAG: DUF2937 family protein [Pseudomonadota bacterium]
MIIRMMALAGGLCGAAGLSQFPEYSQQYTQRLSGAVEELSSVVMQFDADAAQVGMNRTEALNDLSQGSAMAQARAQSMGYVLTRHDRLSAHLATLKTSTALSNTLTSWRYIESDLARQTWADFKPAVPASAEGLGFAAGGFLGGYTLIALALTGLMRLRRKPKSLPQTG